MTASSTTKAASSERPSPAADCGLCPRLRAFRQAQQAAEPDWFNAPVPSFGTAGARLLVVGLAPGLRGANRTGRPFTGDFAGEVLYPALSRHGLADHAFAARIDDGFLLVDCRVTNAVRCVPPANRPTPAEIATCRRFLVGELTGAVAPRVVLALGRIAHESTLARAGSAAAPPSVRAWRGAGAADRPDPRLELPHLSLQHEHRPADHGHVRGGGGADHRSARGAERRLSA